MGQLAHPNIQGQGFLIFFYRSTSTKINFQKVEKSFWCNYCIRHPLRYFVFYIWFFCSFDREVNNILKIILDSNLLHIFQKRVKKTGSIFRKKLHCEKIEGKTLGCCIEQCVTYARSSDWCGKQVFFLFTTTHEHRRYFSPFILVVPRLPLTIVQ